MPDEIDDDIQQRINRVFTELEKAVKAGDLQAVAIAGITKGGDIMTMDVSVKNKISLVGLVRLLQRQIEDRYVEDLEALRSEEGEVIELEAPEGEPN